MLQTTSSATHRLCWIDQSIWYSQYKRAINCFTKNRLPAFTSQPLRPLRDDMESTSYIAHKIYTACILTTLLYSSITKQKCMQQKRKPNIFHIRCHCNICRVSLRGKIRNEVIVSNPRLNLAVYLSCLIIKCLRWLDQVFPSVGRECAGSPRFPRDWLSLFLSKRSSSRAKVHYYCNLWFYCNFFLLALKMALIN